MRLFLIFVIFECIHIIAHAFTIPTLKPIYLCKPHKISPLCYRKSRLDSIKKTQEKDSFIITRSSFLLTCTTITPSISKAIEFVPASPSFNGTYKDAIEILYTQRIALDNIREVISNGKLDEAGFKIMQLSAQSRLAGKIVLDTLQESISSNVEMVRYLSCQKKFALLMDLCDECGITIQDALKGKLGAIAPAQIRVGVVVDDAIRAYDDFLGGF